MAGAQAGLEAGQLPELGREPSCTAATEADGAACSEAMELAAGSVVGACTSQDVAALECTTC